MTAEVAVLNRSAVALAADSAVTVESFQDGHAREKVFNTANKLFTISKYAPVGMMVYNTMSLGGVPWEAIIKEYRRQLGTKTHPRLEDYCDDFFNFLRGNMVLFPPDEQRSVLIMMLIRVFIAIIGAQKSVTNVRRAMEKAVAQLESANDVVHFSDEFRRYFADLYKSDIDMAAGIAAGNRSLRNTKRLYRRLAELLLTKDVPLSGHSGVVVAGFGDDEIYPHLREYIVDAAIGGEIKYRFQREAAISYLNQSAVVPFAEKDAVRTMLEGVNPRYGRHFVKETIRMISQIPREVIAQVTELDDAQRDAYARASMEAVVPAFEEFVGRMNTIRKDDYEEPINRAIAVMPTPELATVAEVFVNLSQIRQRMSLETETVGGPIDVAVISKGDGFVWIKRKHYFDRDLNPFFVGKYFHDVS